jgi:predicted dehydrogenase
MTKTSRLGLLGFGLVGRRHVEAAQGLDTVTFTTVVETDPAGRAAAQAAGLQCVDTLEALLEDHPVDGIVIATPTLLHIEQARACVEAGCPVLVEKPIGVTSREAEATVALAEAKGVPVLVGHHRRHNSIVREAKAILEHGGVGDIRSISAQCLFYKPDSYFDIAPWRKKFGAGPISVNLIHDVDLLRHFCGEIESVQAMSVPSRRGYDNEELASALLRFTSGALATVTVSDSVVSPWSWEFTAEENPVYHPTGQSCYAISGSEGALSVPDLRLWRHQGQPDWWNPLTAEQRAHDGSDSLVNQLGHFHRVLQGQEAPLVGGREGLQSLRVIEAIQEAAGTGARIAVDIGIDSSRKTAVISNNKTAA